MSTQDEFDAIEKRKISRKKFENQKIMQLQDEEIQRLKNELDMLQNHIKGVKIKKMNERKKKEQIKRQKEKKLPLEMLKTQITSLEKYKRSAILQMKRDHNRELNELVIAHFDEMNALRTKYQLKINHNELPPNENQDYITLQLIKNIEQTSNDIQTAVKNKQKEKEKYLSDSLQDVREKVQFLRSKELELRAQIDKERQKLIEGKGLNDQRVENALKVIRERELNSKRSSRNIEDQLLVENARQLASMTEITEEQMKKLDPLRNDVNKQQQRLTEIRSKIRDAHLSFTSEREQLQQQFNAFYEQKDLIDSGLIQIRKQMDNFDDICADEELKVQLLKEQVENANETKKNLIQQNNNLKEEIKRIDFQIYGKSGKYQQSKTKFPQKRRPFVPVGSCST